MSNTSMRGFSLLEMVIVVTVLGIIASIAYPSYLERSQRAKRTDAKAALVNLAAAQERFFLRNNRYADDLDELGITGTENDFYELTVTSASDSEFEGEAKPSGSDGEGQWLDERCTSFKIDQLGRKTATGEGGDNSKECWQR